MGLRDKLIERVQPMLPGEQIQQVFLAQAGVSPWIGNSFGLLGQSMVKRRIIAVTDQGVVVLAAGFNGTNPKEILRRLPRSTRLGPTKGIWSRIDVGGDEKAWVHSRFRKDVEAADAAVAVAE
ncbi:MAG TPA: hypothetical protein VGQ92_04645 [Actinoplanes sp.]|jgi:hypothetical protein|nr:hypothetical protein [Actinoplanes sp.]